MRVLIWSHCIASKYSWHFFISSTADHWATHKRWEHALQIKHWTVCRRCDNSQKFTKNTRISKLNGKGHKAKGRILKLSNGSLWNEYLGILLFLAMQYLYCAPRTLSCTHIITIYSTICILRIWDENLLLSGRTLEGGQGGRSTPQNFAWQRVKILIFTFFQNL